VRLSLITALICLFLVPEILVDKKLFDRMPRVGLAIWTAMLMVGWFSTLVFFLRVALHTEGSSLQAGVNNFIHQVRVGHPLQGMGFFEIAALSIVTDFLILLLVGLVRAVIKNGVARYGQRAVIDLVCQQSLDQDDVHVLEHDIPTAYFVPGRGGRIVLSSGAVATLHHDELLAVIAHERGHRNSHHGMLLTGLQAMSPFVSFVSGARYAPREMQNLIEMAADDVACANTSLSAVRSALLKAKHFGPSPFGALGLTSLLLDRRIERLALRTHGLVQSYLVVAVLAMALSSALLVALH
jgi:Peptidase family M48